jgi:hypothetical protein
MRRTLLLLTTMVVALLLAGGVALAANIQCLVQDQATFSAMDRCS